MGLKADRNGKIAESQRSVERALFYSVPIQNVEQPERWWKSQSLVLGEEEAVLRQSLVHEEAFAVRLAPNVAVGIAIESRRVFAFDRIDRVFLADVHADNLSRQSIDDSHTSLHACNFADNVALITPPELGPLVLLLESRRKNWNVLTMLVDSFQRLTALIKGPAQVLAGELDQQS
jgi:hypothetical protein